MLTCWRTKREEQTYEQTQMMRFPQLPDLNLVTNSDDEDLMDLEPQDADYSGVPELCTDLEILIMARTPRFLYWRLHLLNRQFSYLLRSGGIFKIRRRIGFSEPSVFMHPSGDACWWGFDRDFNYCRKLPELPSDGCFSSGDKETLCAGTHLIVSGREISGIVVWRYELETDQWHKGPSMITPRCLFGSATCGTYAYVAGGIEVKQGTEFINSPGEVLNTAEMYDQETKTWFPLPRMHKRRRLCAGCYLDGKFYVLGGRDEKGEYLTCGEFYDEGRNAWELVTDMLKDTPFSTLQCPPLIAVVNDKLYSLETSSNMVRVYQKSAKEWKKLGPAPVRSGANGGWGVAFKSLGDELLMIGASLGSGSGDAMAVYTCKPEGEGLLWRQVECCCNCRLNHFIHNCSVMVA